MLGRGGERGGEFDYVISPRFDISLGFQDSCMTDHPSLMRILQRGGMRELEVTERVKRNKYVEKVERMLKKKISVKF